MPKRAIEKSFISKTTQYALDRLEIERCIPGTIEAESIMTIALQLALELREFDQLITDLRFLTRDAHRTGLDIETSGLLPKLGLWADFGEVDEVASLETRMLTQTAPFAMPAGKRSGSGKLRAVMVDAHEED